MTQSTDTSPPDGGDLLQWTGASLAATGAVLRWAVGFYVAHLPLLLAISAVPLASRWAIVLRGDRTDGWLATPVEFVVVAFRLLLVLAIVAAARGERASPGTYRAMLEPETLDPALAAVTERVVANWPTLLLQFAFLALFFGAINLAVSWLTAEPVVAGTLARAGFGDADARTAGRLVAFTVKNVVVIPLAVICAYGVGARA